MLEVAQLVLEALGDQELQLLVGALGPVHELVEGGVVQAAQVIAGQEPDEIRRAEDQTAVNEAHAAPLPTLLGDLHWQQG